MCFQCELQLTERDRKCETSKYKIHLVSEVGKRVFSIKAQFIFLVHTNVSHIVQLFSQSVPHQIRSAFMSLLTHWEAFWPESGYRGLRRNQSCWRGSRTASAGATEEADNTIKKMWISKSSKLKNTNTKKKNTNLCDVLCWHDCIAHVPASWSWCQNGAWREVGEVGLDLGQWSGGHDEALLCLIGGYYRCWC